jgi:hypothetical protein
LIDEESQVNRRLLSGALTLSLLLAPAILRAETGPQVVNVLARGLTFVAPEQVPGGWLTFRLRNESDMVHFALVQRLPEGIGVDDQQAQVAPVFQRGMDLINQGKPDAAMEAFGELPGWFGQVVPLGGTGLVGPHQTAESTVYLEPGTYLLECYIKTNGIFHSYNPDPDVTAMVHEFTVGEAVSAAPEPEADLRMTISAAGGIELEGQPAPGRQTIAVHFKDQKAHENFQGHDVHLARLEDDTDLARLEAWMDWSQPDGFQTPAPVMFLGGINEMPAGQTGYLHVNLEPGRYAWVAEVPGAMAKGMLQVFTVAASPL